MGMFKTPKPAPNPELDKQKADQAKINKQEAELQAFETSEKNRKIAGNLYGNKSLQGDDMDDFSGYRRKMMGGNKNA
jgi:predicted ribosome quality control (RQC) complex YloA/Tae2 family protein